MEKTFLSPNDLTVVMFHLWCKDGYEYRGKHGERGRVQFSGAILLYCFSSARTGEVHESTARRIKDEDRKEEDEVEAACYKVRRYNIFLTAN